MKQHKFLLCYLNNLHSFLSLILTHQTPLEIEGMYNPGGFTDGDRAVCIALALGAENIELLRVELSILPHHTHTEFTVHTEVCILHHNRRAILHQQTTTFFPF